MKLGKHHGASQVKRQAIRPRLVVEKQKPAPRLDARFGRIA